jgi:hypothetical protein
LLIPAASSNSIVGPPACWRELVDLSLLHDGVRGLAHAVSRKSSRTSFSFHGERVDEVFAFTGPVQALLMVDLRHSRGRTPPSFHKGECHLCHAERFPIVCAVEDDVFHLLGS